ncbi:MAG: glycoside hydrolase family 97 protein [Prevotellaceae bacterium]|jgi:hypothetical protein|nr:glycoside hydrolase family 97 protein [Prevotellaceae bacterium]
MKQNTFLLVWLALLTACGQVSRQTTSPDGALSATLVTEPAHDNAVAIRITDARDSLLLSIPTIGLETDRQRFADNLRLLSVSTPVQVTDDYTMITGKRTHCFNQGTERAYHLANEAGDTLTLTIRAYNDGIAFKYGIRAAQGDSVARELTTYLIPEGTTRWIQGYDAQSYERLYTPSTDGKATRFGWRPPTQEWAYPALVELPESRFALITESNIRRDHCGSLLDNEADLSRYQVRYADPKQPCNGAWESPWRVLIIGSLSTVVESTLVNDLADPNKLADTSWIIPGTAAWIYWAYNHGSDNYQIVKQYIDLAARMKWRYDLIDAEWDRMGNGGNVEDAVRYALSKGVKPMIWYNSSISWLEGAPTPQFRLNDPAKRDREFAWLDSIGVVGAKVDFFAGDQASTMNYYIDLLEDAARHKLMMNFLGATLPRGWQRTYPNMMTVEAVYGAEWYNNNRMLTNAAAAHNATLPFTRNVVGSMDYTPGTFTDSQNPHITTHGHELALQVLFESALQHRPDRPETYYNLPEAVQHLLTVLPTVWDDTLLLSGYPGTDVVMARRSGNAWYIAGINGTNEPRTLSFSLDRLTSPAGKALLIKDGADSTSFDIRADYTLPTDKQITVACLPRGGFTLIIE